VVGPGLHVQAMTHDRRTEKERRDGTERRRGSGARGFLLRLLKGERRQLEDRRRLDSALVRLKFAIERLEKGQQPTS